MPSSGEHQRRVVVAGVRTHLGQEAVGDLLEALGHRDDWRVEHHQVQAAEEQHAGQGDDEGRDADVRHPEALPGADQAPRTRPSRIAERPRHVPVVIAGRTTAPTNAATDPTDRSMWPAMITITMPMARIRM